MTDFSEAWAMQMLTQAARDAQDRGNAGAFQDKFRRAQMGILRTDAGNVIFGGGGGGSMRGAERCGNGGGGIVPSAGGRGGNGNLPCATDPRATACPDDFTTAAMKFSATERWVGLKKFPNAGSRSPSATAWHRLTEDVAGLSIRTRSLFWRELYALVEREYAPAPDADRTAWAIMHATPQMVEAAWAAVTE